MTNNTTPNQEQMPLPPKPVAMVMNTLMKGILHSPMHGMVSERLMLITFTGRKTGKHYTTPVTYLREGNRVMCFTVGKWWRNFQQPAPAKVRLQGKTHSGTGHAITDANEVAAGARRFADQYGYEMLRFIGIHPNFDHDPTTGELAERIAAQGRVMIVVDINPSE